MGLSCGLGLPEAAGLVTVNLTMDFVASAGLGQWVEVRPLVTRLGGSLAFATAAVFADDQICASGSAVFRVLGRRAPA
jgi:acyl-coenzyme A thioesterase PaaI-like protein